MTALLDKALEVMRARRGDFEKRYGISLVGVVGSVARGEERADSDIDIVIDVAGPTTYFEVGAAAEELGDALGRRVDLVLRRAMRPDRRAYMERDLVLLQ